VKRTVREVFDDLVRLETLLWNRVDSRVRAEVGVGLGSVDVLGVVATTPDCRVNDVAAALAITVGGASQAVDRLVARELSTRRPHPVDRRSSVVELTPLGHEQLSTAQSVIDAELEVSLRGPLSDRSLKQLGTTLAALRHAAAASPAPAPSVPTPNAPAGPQEQP
jgi:DNA-binding MarR family transcriptional regulator